MPVNTLSIKNRELTEFEATTPDSSTVNITGVYKLTIENEGLLPTFVSQYKLEKLTPTAINKSILAEKTNDVGRVQPGSTKSISFRFTLNGSQTQLMDIAETGCNGDVIKCEIKEELTGRLLALPFDKKRNLSVSAGSCSLRPDVGQAQPTPEPTPSEPVQNLTMRIDGPTEVTDGQENSWVIEGNNVNRVSQIVVELGDGSTTTTRRELQAQNPRQPASGRSGELGLTGRKRTGTGDNTSSDAGQVFTHTYTSEGQYTIVAEAINSNGQTVGSARYNVTVNVAGTTNPVQPEPTKPANFNITVDNKNEPVNPGGQMVIDYTVENTGEASGTGNVTLNIDGQRADSSRRTVNAGSSTSGTLTATAPQIDSSSVIFRPQVTAEDVESNTVSPSFQVSQQDSSSGDSDDEQNQTSQPVNITITNSYVDYDGAGQVGIEYEVANQTNQSQSVNIERYLSGTWIGNNQQNIAPGSAYESSYTIGYDGPGEYELGIKVDNQTQIETVTAEGQEEQTDPAQLNLQIIETSGPVGIGEDLDVEYRLRNTGGQSTTVDIDVNVSSANAVQAQITETVNPGQTIRGDFTIPSTAYGTPGQKTLTFGIGGITEEFVFTVEETEPDISVAIMSTNAPVRLAEDLEIRFALRNRSGQEASVRPRVTIENINYEEQIGRIQVPSNEIVNRTVTVPSHSYKDSTELNVTMSVETGGRNISVANPQVISYTSTQDILDNTQGLETPKQIIKLHGETLIAYDEDGNAEISPQEAINASQAYDGGEITESQMRAVEEMFTRVQKFPQSRDGVERFLSRAHLIFQVDDNGDGKIQPFELLDAQDMLDNGEITEAEYRDIQYIFQNNIHFPTTDPQSAPNPDTNIARDGSERFLPPTMDEAVNSGF